MHQGDTREKYSEKRRLGNIGEDVACEFLQRKGFTVIERNYLKPWGEIDIIAKKGETVRFIEVKTVTRENTRTFSRESSWYRPEEQIHASKLKKVARTAEIYMNGKNSGSEYQVDAVTVILDTKRRRAQCTLYEQIL